MIYLLKNFKPDNMRNPLKYSLIALLCSISLLFQACSTQNKDEFEVNGRIKNWDEISLQFPGTTNNDKMTVLLMEVPFGGDMQPIQLDSVTITKNKPEFTLKTKFKSIGMYDVVIAGNGPVIPLVNDASPLLLEIDLLAKTRYYTIEGSQGSRELQDFIYGYSEKGAQTNKALSLLDSLKQVQAPDSVLIHATENKNKSIDALNDYLKSVFKITNSGTVAAFALSRASQTLSQSDYEGLLLQVTRKFPQDIHLVAIQKQYKAYKEQLAEEERRRQLNSWIGKKVPDFSLPDSSGNNISLSSFKGKYVLVDFWASWCEPCRNENPNVVAAYRKFKGKNFSIWGISLDKTKDAWVKAIKDDKLQWAHSSDLSFWNSAAVKTFHFEEIPFNILVGPDGTVIAERLKGEDLMKKLEEVLK